MKICGGESDQLGVYIVGLQIGQLVWALIGWELMVNVFLKKKKKICERVKRKMEGFYCNAVRKLN